MIRSLLLFLLLPLAPLHAEELPIEHFGHLPMIDEPSVSPNGEYVAALLNGEDGPTLVVSEFGKRDLNAIVKLKYADDRVEWIDWANDDRLLISVSEAAKGTKERFRVNRLYQVRRDGSDMKQIRRKPTREVPDWVSYLDTDNVKSMLPEDPEHILMQLWDERDNGPAVFRVNLEKNDFDKQFANVYDVENWFVDGEGNVVLGLERLNNTITLWYRSNEDNEWQELHEFEAFEDETFSPVSIEGDKAIVLSDRETGFEAAWQYDIPSGQFEELIFGADGHDLVGGILSNDRASVVGFYYYDDYREDHYIDPSVDAIWKTVKASFPAYATQILNRSTDGQRLMLSALRDDAPPKFIWMDVNGPAAGAWYAEFPYLEGKPMAGKQNISFAASDGTTIEGYLTLPVTGSSDKPPLIVHPHGGPHSRDYKYFDPYVQFMANRGYAVLQVNFRGSSGFGTQFEAAGYRQWGQLMQQDIYDAVDWLAEQDLVDVDKKCMVGFSYGGYASLVAAYQRPQDYQCIVSVAGVPNLYEMVERDSKSTRSRHVIAKSIGDIGDPVDREMLKENSAINHVTEIRAPMLLVHGTQDTRVRVSQSRAFYNKAEEIGLDIEYIEIEDGTHFLDGYANRLTVFKAIDEFLDEHL